MNHISSIDHPKGFHLPHIIKSEEFNSMRSALGNWVDLGPEKEKQSRTLSTEKILACFLMQLPTLVLTSVKLTALPPEIGQLTHLNVLNLTFNLLDSLPPEIVRLENLQIFKLEGNAIQSLPAQMQWSKLRHLNLSNNRSNVAVQEAEFLFGICGLTNLQVLDLSANLLTALPVQICQLVNLEELKIDHNTLQSLPAGMSQLKRLNHLALNNNLFLEFSYEICELTDLKYLNYSFNELTTLPTQICQLTSLERFNINCNQLSMIPPEVAHLTNLRELFLGRNRISSLPNEILNLPFSTFINLEENPLSQPVIDNLQQVMNTDDPAPRIIYSMPSAFVDNRPLNDLLNELAEAAEQPLFDLPNLRAKEEDLKNWLSRLSAIGDYKTKRKELASLIYQALIKAEQQADFRAFFWNCIKDAHKTCGDRMALSVIYLDLQYQIEAASHDLAQLAYLLVHGTWALSELEKIAGNKARTLKFVDEIEVYLAYPIQLKDKLLLPIVLDTMLYFRCSSVTEDDLERAAEIIKSGLSNKATYCDFLAKDPNWQKALERERPEEYVQIERRKDLASEKAETDQDYANILNTFHKQLSDFTSRVLDQVRH